MTISLSSLCQKKLDMHMPPCEIPIFNTLTGEIERVLELRSNQYSKGAVDPDELSRLLQGNVPESCTFIHQPGMFPELIMNEIANFGSLEKGSPGRRWFTPDVNHRYRLEYSNDQGLVRIVQLGLPHTLYTHTDLATRWFIYGLIGNGWKEVNWNQQ
jgi:hypothetical protein